MTLFPTALEEAAKAMHGSQTWSSFWSIDDARLLTTAAITAYLAQAEKEGWVMVPLNMARKVTSIARRNEDAPEIHELSSLLAAAQNGGDLPAPPKGK